MTRTIRLTLVVVFVTLGLASAACTSVPPDGSTTTTSTTAPTNWDFTMQVAVQQNLIAPYGGQAALEAKVVQQLAAIGARFAALGPIHFTVAKFVYFPGSANDQVGLAHTGADFQIIYTEDPGYSTGWYGDVQTLMTAWGPAWGGSFGATATDAITHELGHARGAIDMYAMEVNPAQNPVNGQGYAPETSIMSYPYGVTTWDGCSAAVITKSANQIYQNAPVFNSLLPSTYSLQVTQGGVNVTSAAIAVYAVRWFSGAVESTPIQTGVTNASGVFQLTGNPFAGTVGTNWDTSMANLLITATKGGKTVSTWLPISEACKQGAAHPGTAFAATISLG